MTDQGEKMNDMVLNNQNVDGLKRVSVYDKLRRIVSIWLMRYMTRKELACMDARQLKDIGVSRLDQQVESNKPFWR